MNRRDFLLGTGAAGLAALSLTGRRDARATERPRRPPRRLLAVFASGGWDTTFAIDPKEPPLATVPAGAPRLFGGLDVFTDASRPSTTAYFERYAPVTAIVRGIATDGIFHNECLRRIATGKRDENQPDIAAMVAHDLGNALPIPYLILGDVAYTGAYAASAARVGTTNQIVELLGPPVADPLAATEGALLQRYANAAVARARSTRGAAGYNRRRIDDFADSLARGDRLRQLRDRFGARGETQSLASQIPLALDAIQQDVSHAVMMSTRLAWDTHNDNHLQGDYHESMFRDLTELLDQLVTRPGLGAGSKMIDDTVVVVFSELSRTPIAAGNAPHEGKGHWPLTAALVIGAAVNGGQAFGATTPASEGMPIDLATGRPSSAGLQPMYSHFAAGLLALCGSDPAQHFAATPVFDAFVA